MYLRNRVAIGSAALVLLGFSRPRSCRSRAIKRARRTASSRPACNATGWKVSRIRASI